MSTFPHTPEAFGFHHNAPPRPAITATSTNTSQALGQSSGGAPQHGPPRPPSVIPTNTPQALGHFPGGAPQHGPPRPPSVIPTNTPQALGHFPGGAPKHGPPPPASAATSGSRRNGPPHPGSVITPKRIRDPASEEQQENERRQQAAQKTAVRLVGITDPEVQLQAQFDRLRQQLLYERTENSKNVKQLELQIEFSNARFQELQDSILSNRSQDAMDQDPSINSVAEERDVLGRQLDDIRTQLSQAQQQRDAALQENAALSAAAQTLRQNGTTPSEPDVQLQTELSNIRDELTSVNNDRDRLRRELETAEQSLISARQQVQPQLADSQSQQVHDLVQEQEKYKNIVIDLENQLQRQQFAYNGLEEQLLGEHEDARIELAENLQREIEEKKALEERIFTLEQDAKRAGKQREGANYGVGHAGRNILQAARKRNPNSRYKTHPSTGKPSVTATYFGLQDNSDDSDEEEFITMDVDDHTGSPSLPSQGGPRPPQPRPPQSAGQGPYSTGSTFPPESSRPPQPGSYSSANQHPSSSQQPQTTNSPFFRPPQPSQSHLAGQGPYFAGSTLSPNQSAPRLPQLGSYFPANQRPIYPYSQTTTPRPPQPGRSYTTSQSPHPSQQTQTFAPGQIYPPSYAANSTLPSSGSQPPPVVSPRPQQTVRFTSPPVAPPNSHQRGNGIFSPPIAPPNSHNFPSARAEPTVGEDPHWAWYTADSVPQGQHIQGQVNVAVDPRFRQPQPRSSYQPFRDPAPAFRRPRSDSHNEMMGLARKFLDRLMAIPEGKSFIEIMAPDMFANPKFAKQYEEGHHPGPLLQPFLIDLDDESSRWNDTLGDLFVRAFVTAYPRMAGRNDIKTYFTDRVRTMKNKVLVARPGETGDDCTKRLQGEIQKSYHDNRVRSRLVTLKAKRVMDCRQRVDEDPENVVTAEICEALDSYGHSSDESDGCGNRIVRRRLWRNQSLLNRLAIADSNHSRYTVTGSVKPGGLPQPRIRRIDGPVSDRKMPKRQPVNFYDQELLARMSPQDYAKLDPKPALPFRGEHDPVDQSIYENFPRGR